MAHLQIIDNLKTKNSKIRKINMSLDKNDACRAYVQVVFNAQIFKQRCVKIVAQTAEGYVELAVVAKFSEIK